VPDHIFHYDAPKVWDGLSSELQVQRSCRDMIAKAFRQTDSFAVPNGTHIASIAGRAKAKREGLLKGVSDLVIIGKPGLVAFAEIKAGGSLTVEQRAFLTRVVELGHRAGCFRSVDTLYLKLKDWGFS
jgi:hypothetical protein